MTGAGPVVGEYTDNQLRAWVADGTLRLLDGRVQMLRQPRCNRCGCRHRKDECGHGLCSDHGETWPTADALVHALSCVTTPSSNVTLGPDR